MVVSPDGGHVYAAGPAGLLAYARDRTSGRLTLVDALEAGGHAVAISPDGTSVYAASSSYLGPPMILTFQRSPDGKLLQRQASLPDLPAVHTLAVSPDGRNLYASGSWTGAIAVYRRAPDGTLALQSRTSEASASDVSLSPDGRFVHAGSTRLRRGSAGGDLTVDGYEPHPDQVEGSGNYAFAADGSHAFGGFGAAIGTFRRDASTGALTRSALWRGPGMSIDFGALALSPDGRHLVSALSQSGLLRLFRTAGDGQVELVQEHTGGRSGSQEVGYPVTATWAPDGRSLYVGSEYSKISVWSLAPGGDSLALAQSLQLDAPPGWRGPKAGSVAIAAGERYTNSPNARLLVGTPRANTLQISDRPDFQGAPVQRTRLDGSYSWKLRNTGLARGARKVYVRYIPSFGAARRGVSDSVTVDVADGIVLDQRRPSILRATLSRRGKRRSVLRIRARDSRSGVRRLQVARVRSRPSKLRRATGKLILRGQPRRLWIRAVDGAGNRSRWTAVRRR